MTVLATLLVALEGAAKFNEHQLSAPRFVLSVASVVHDADARDALLEALAE